MVVGGLLMCFVVSFMAVLFQATLVFSTTERLRAGDVTIRTALGNALRQSHKLFLWNIQSIWANFLGVLSHSGKNDGILRQLIGQLASEAIGFWAARTIFVIPLLVHEKLTYEASHQRSSELVKETWGDSANGSVNTGCLGPVIALLVGLVVFIVSIVFDSLTPAFVCGAIGGSLWVLVHYTVKGIHIAALYQYATTGEPPDGFDKKRVASMFS